MGQRGDPTGSEQNRAGANLNFSFCQTGTYVDIDLLLMAASYQKLLTIRSSFR